MSTVPSSVSGHHAISVVVSDEEPDNVDPRVRLVWARRKRGRQPLLASRRWKKNVILYTATRKLLKWWPFILFIPAVSFLVFGAWRTFGSDHRRPALSQMRALNL
ncbi:hypothetical protein FNV43_RR22722 [Rhamnella rubrinervis]|uniref:Uncharacterized protein n=1 Tax=Rhamnella rubrinervis TaxID=2594499 RepID=A0A8K0DVS4_9ROSA|nr:hypothetical protein FNV43_RR22722 [Rhamnella rubrinervis]